MKRQTHKTQQGFTLIELMVVIAIIGIIASIAMPIYSTYMAKTQFESALKDISPGKVDMDAKLSVDAGASISGAEEIGLRSITMNCSLITADSDTDADAHITCAMRSFAEQQVWLTRRSSDGVWFCDTDLDADLKEKYAGDKCNGDSV